MNRPLTSLIAAVALIWGASASAVEVSVNRIFIRLGSRSASIPYYRTVALSAGSPASRAVIVIHGAGGGGKLNYDGMMAAANAAGVAADTIVFGPQFITREDADENGLDASVLTWGKDNWKYGDWSDTYDSEARITSFEIIDRIVDYLSNRARYPNLRELVIAGHSAGGQFVTRYAAGNGIEDVVSQRGLHVRYIVANPSTYLYMDGQRPLDGGITSFRTPRWFEVRECRDYNDYKYGLDNRYGYMASVSAADIRERFERRDVRILLGERDRYACAEGLDRSCAANWQGSSRLERGLAYHNYLGHYYGDRVYASHLLMAVEDVGHSSWGIWNSAVGRWNIFDVYDASVERIVQEAPRGTILDRRTAIQWYALPRVSEYEVEIYDPTGLRLSTVFTAAFAGCENGGLCDVPFPFDLADGRCRWRIRPRIGFGRGPWRTRWFSVGRPGQILALAPRGTIMDHTPTYRWHRDPGVDEYEITVSEGGVRLFTRTFTEAEACPCGDWCQVTLDDHLPDSEFVWTIRGQNVEGWGARFSMPFVVETPEVLPDGVYTLRVESTLKCLDADSARDDTNGGNVQLWCCSGEENQRWRVVHLGARTYSVTVESSGKALDADNHDGSDRRDGGNVQVWDYLGGGNQHWVVEALVNGYYSVFVDSSAKCLDADSARDRTDGCNVQVWDCNRRDNQVWIIEPWDSYEF